MTLFEQQQQQQKPPVQQQPQSQSHSQGFPTQQVPQTPQVQLQSQQLQTQLQQAQFRYPQQLQQPPSQSSMVSVFYLLMASFISCFFYLSGILMVAVSGSWSFRSTKFSGILHSQLFIL